MKERLVEKNKVELILFGKVGGFFIPLVELDAVGWFIANFDEATLHFLGPEVVERRSLARRLRSRPASLWRPDVGWGNRD
jgi:hypothetical protein